MSFVKIEDFEPLLSDWCAEGEHDRCDGMIQAPPVLSIPCECGCHE